MEVLVLFWLICGALGAWIASYKQQGGMGCLLGVLLGPLGVLIACFVPSPPSHPSPRPYVPDTDDVRRRRKIAQTRRKAAEDDRWPDELDGWVDPDPPTDALR